jgi:eukaryotic-like serine/threonine-protein kinase
MSSPGRAQASAAEVGGLPTEIATPLGGEPPPYRTGAAAASAAGSATPGPDALPSDLLGEAVRRLSTAMWAVAAIYAVYAVLFATVWRDYAGPVNYIAGLSALIVSVVLPFQLRRCQHSQRRLFQVGLVYELSICLAIELDAFWRIPLDEFSVRASWACLVIALFPVLVPAPLKRVIVSSLLAALMTPLAFGIALWARGLPAPPLAAALSLLLPPFLAAGLALVPAHVFGRLNAHVRRARRLGSYRLIEKLGAGGMGEVWRAEHELLVRPAAVKLVRPELGVAPAARRSLLERFEREAQATAALESPHTVELYDFGVSDDGVFYYVMELLRGSDLDSLVHKYGPMPPERVAHILIQACESLDDAHRGGMIHRDIKPANIFLAHRAGVCDFVKVLDFGLVKIEDRDDVSLSRAGEIHGTPAFMAPEIATGEGAVDGRSDLYSLGCVAYWLLTGKLVFDEPTSMKMALAHATRDAVPPSRRGAVVPPPLERLVMDCLAKDPAARPTIPADLAERLRQSGLAAGWSREHALAWWREREPEVQAQAHGKRSLHKPGGELLAPARLKRSSFGAP